MEDDSIDIDFLGRHSEPRSIQVVRNRDASSRAFKLAHAVNVFDG